MGKRLRRANGDICRLYSSNWRDEKSMKLGLEDLDAADHLET
jgi:hypothetical protein